MLGLCLAFPSFSENRFGCVSCGGGGCGGGGGRRRTRINYTKIGCCRALTPTEPSFGVGRKVLFSLRPSRKQFSCPVIPPPPLFLPSTSTSLPPPPKGAAMLAFRVSGVATNYERRAACVGRRPSNIAFLFLFLFLSASHSVFPHTSPH